MHPTILISSQYSRFTIFAFYFPVWAMRVHTQEDLTICVTRKIIKTFFEANSFRRFDDLHVRCVCERSDRQAPFSARSN